LAYEDDIEVILRLKASGASKTTIGVDLHKVSFIVAKKKQELN
jgi:hypothetical protein